MASPVPIAPTGPSCRACGAPAVVHWQRRLLPDEIAAQQQIEQERRNDATLLADPQLPAPVFPPMAGFLDATAVVLACAEHGITLDAAAHVHQAACAAPPVCDCTPEPLPVPDPEPDPVELPAGW